MIGTNPHHDEVLAALTETAADQYTGKHATFMPSGSVLDVVANCVGDKRAAVTKAVGWVLRETMADDESAVRAFLETHATVISAATRRGMGTG